MNRGKYKILIVIIIVLLIANMVTLYFLINDKRKRNGNRNDLFTNYLKKDIGFNDLQIKTYDSLLEKHRTSMKADFTKTDMLRKNSLKKLPENNFSDSIIKISVENNSGFYKQMQIQMLNHLRDVRNICTADQQNKFDTSFYKFIFNSKKNKY